MFKNFLLSFILILSVNFVSAMDSGFLGFEKTEIILVDSFDFQEADFIVFKTVDKKGSGLLEKRSGRSEDSKSFVVDSVKVVNVMVSGYRRYDIIYHYKKNETIIYKLYANKNIGNKTYKVRASFIGNNRKLRSKVARDTIVSII